MMSLIDLDDDQRWVPTHVNVTVLRAKALRTKGKHGSRYLYTIIQMGKEKYTTGLVEKAEMPAWNEECCFELLPGILEEGSRSCFPPGSGDLVFTVMHRVLIGLDVFLGQTIIPLDKIFQEGMCPRDEWFKLNSKAGRKEKERGELQVTVQFTRNNMTASMFDLTIKDKPQSAFGKLKDRVTGKKKGDVESSSAIVPGRYAALSGSLGQPFEENSFSGEVGGGGGVKDSRDVEISEEKRSKMKDFFKGKLRKSSDTRSCSSLASDSSMSSMASDNPGPPPSLDLMSDPPSSPIYTSKVRVDTHLGETDLAKKVLTSQHTTKVLTHKRALSDEASKITTAFPRTNLAVESLKGQSMTQSKSSLCINGSHVYESEPSTPKNSAALHSKLVLLEKCSPLSRSLQNLTKKSEDKVSFSEGRRWSFDKVRKEEKEEEKEIPPSQHAKSESGSTQAGSSSASSSGGSPEKGKKLRKSLFSGGRSESLPVKSDLNQAASGSEGRLRGWFGSGDSQNKPRLEVSPKVESSSDMLPPLSPHSPIPLSPHCTSPSHQVSPDDHTSCDSPSSTPVSPSNPFLPQMQRNPFFEELVGEDLHRSPPLSASPSAGSSPFHYISLSSTPSPACDGNSSIRRERPRPVARQTSLPALLPRVTIPHSPNHLFQRSMSGDMDDGFKALASSRINSPKGAPSQKHLVASPTLFYRSRHPINPTQDLQPPPLPPRRLLRTQMNEIYSDGWLHRGQELAVHKEAYLLSQTGVASRHHGRSSASPDSQTNSETSDSISVPSKRHTNTTSTAFICEEKPKKFKYEPLEDVTNCWGGMLFEQDLYGRMYQVNCGQPKFSGHHLSLTSENNSTNNAIKENTSVLPESKISVKELLNMSNSNFTNPDFKDLDRSCSPVEEAVQDNPTEDMCANNNVSFSLTLEDLNMNVDNMDFGFIDSDGSSQSEVADTLKSIKSLGEFSPETGEDSPTADYQKEIIPEDMDMDDMKISEDPSKSINILEETFKNTCRAEDTLKKDDTPWDTLENTNIDSVTDAKNPVTNEITVSPSKLCKVSPVCQGSCRDCPPCNNSPKTGCKTGILSPSKLKSDLSILETKLRQVGTMSDNEFRETQKGIDDNGNLRAELKQTQMFSGVVSARLRPRGVASPKPHSRSGDNVLEKDLSPFRNIPEASESLVVQRVTQSFRLLGLQEDTNTPLQKNVKNNVPRLTKFCLTGKPPEVSFLDLHAKVAPNLRSPSLSMIGGSLQEHPLCTPSIPSAFLQTIASPSPASCPSINLTSIGPSTEGSSTLVVAPYISSTFTSTSDRPLIDVHPSLLPEETQSANNLPRQESRPHPVKPLTSSQSEKKEGRSVLEKLKSTIHPGRSSAHQVAAEAERSQESIVDNTAQYQHLTNMELISLLLQQEMDMQKQQAASEQQGAQLEKCEAELKKVKAQVRDLEDYIDNLLLRIMEQTPTLLQVRNRHK